MHLSWRDLEELSRSGKSAWRLYACNPHLLFCAKCRKELKSHVVDRSLILKLKAAYARDEKIHTMINSLSRTRRSQ